MPVMELVMVCLLDRYLHWLELQYRCGGLPDRCITLPSFEHIMEALEN